MDQETAVNLFVYFNGDRAMEVGYVAHLVAGSDEQIVKILQDHIATDHLLAQRAELRDTLSLKDVNIGMMQGSLQWRILDQIGFPENILYLMTMVRDGAIIIEQMINDLPESESTHFLLRYSTSAGFDFNALLEDDYMGAIKILWNDSRYVSALKLMLSMIDTFGYLHLGDSNRSFQRWVDEFNALDGLDITADELWELRNSLLHMTGGSSRRILDGTIAELEPCIIHPDADLPLDESGVKPLHLSRFLLRSLPNAFATWVKQLSAHPEQARSFIVRYEEIMSDVRVEKKSLTN